MILKGQPMEGKQRLSIQTQLKKTMTLKTTENL